MTDLDVKGDARGLTRHRRPPARILVLAIAGVTVPFILIVTGLVLVFSNLGGDSNPPAEPALDSPLSTRVTSLSPTDPPTAAGPIPSAAPSVDPQLRAVDLAQELATDLASHDYAAARALSVFAQSDDSLTIQYQPVTRQVVVPVDITPIGPSQYRLRLALVSNQSSQNISTTVFYCVAWTVDSGARTIVQGGGVQLKASPGLLDAGDYPDLIPACHRTKLP